MPDDASAAGSRGVQTWITPKARKGVTSGIAGRGLVAAAAIGKGEVVAVKGGHIVTTAMLRSLPEHLQNSDVQITDDLHLVALTDDEYESVMLFINHSCEPNVGFGGNVVLVAMRDIEAGEELTTDYALFDDYEGSMECDCGSPLCRGRIDGRDWQRPELQERYRGYFSWYLEKRLRTLAPHPRLISRLTTSALTTSPLTTSALTTSVPPCRVTAFTVQRLYCAPRQDPA